MANHSLREGKLEVSLTDDAYDYNDRQFTLEVTEVGGDDNDADVSGLYVTASQAEIDAYLAAALAAAKERAGSEVNVRRVASYAAQAGMKVVLGMQDTAPASPAKPKSTGMRP